MVIQAKKSLCALIRTKSPLGHKLSLKVDDRYFTTFPLRVLALSFSLHYILRAPEPFLFKASLCMAQVLEPVTTELLLDSLSKECSKKTGVKMKMALH